MSRYTAHVRQHDTLAGQFACDTIHVDDGGDLHLGLRHGTGDPVTVARFQHGHWGSYTLDLTDEGQDAEPDIDGSPADEPKRPGLKDMVHLVTPARPGCVPSFVYRIGPDDTVILWPEFDPGPYPRNINHDETRQAELSWHWPCDGDKQPAEPDPHPLAPMEISITVQGSVASEHDLIAAVRGALLSSNARRAEMGLPPLPTR